jgi:hypothetical protein
LRRQRYRQQRTLCRRAGLESAALHKDPKKGKRVSRPNPEAKWIRTEVPELRIVDDELWQRVKLRQAELATQFGSTIKGVRKARAERLNRLCRPAFLLSGLLTCGCCGGKYGIDKAGARLRRGSVCRHDERGEFVIARPEGKRRDRVSAVLPEA